MITPLLDALGAGLHIWESAQKTKYLDEYLSLRRQYHDEYAKADDVRSDAVLDDLVSRLCILAAAFSTAVGASNAPTIAAPPAG